ncbi:MAG: CBS domain-containing protein [Thermoleophilia bacterium]|nr:CBS domain-containing protein [Thermoleophilia bacterium]
MNVSKIMTRDVRTCGKTSILMDCARLMKDLNVGAIPVVDDNGHLAGIITDRDITIRAVAEGADSKNERVGDFMTPSPFTVEPETSIEEAAEVMGRHQIRRLPVVENGNLVGIVSFGDLSVKTAEPAMAHVLRDVSMPLSR